MNNTEKLHELASSGRLLAAFDAEIRPMLERKIQDKIQHIRAKVKSNDKDLIIDCVEITVLVDLIDEIEAQKKRGLNAAMKLKQLGDM